MFEDFFAKKINGTNQKTKPAPTIQRGSLFEDFFADRISKRTAISNQPLTQKPTTHKISPSLGGGEFNLPANSLVTSTKSQDAIGPTKKGFERDHIIPAALGGTSNKENLQYLEDNKSWINKILGRETTFEERQQGKIVVEHALIRDVKSGKLSLAEARAKALQKQREIQGLDPKQGITPYLIPGMKDTFTEGGSKVKEVFSDLSKKAKEVIDNDLPNGFDSALRDQLIKRGEFDKLQKLEQEYLDTHGQKGFYAPNRRPVQETELDIKQKENRKQAVEFGATILQAPQRAITSVAGESVAGILSLMQGKEKEFNFEPKTKLEKALFGKEPIKGIFTRTDEAQEQVETTLQKIGFDKDSAKGQALILAPLFMTGSIALDLSPFGGSKNTAKLVARSKNVDEIFDMIKPMLKNQSDDEVRAIAQGFVNIDQPEVIKDILLKKVAKPAEVKTAEVVVPEIKPLVEEAKKYKSADEFADKTKANFSNFLESYARREYKEQVGHEILQNLVNKNIPPTDVAKKFWSETYDKMPLDVQKRFNSLLEKQGNAPGDVFMTTKDGVDVIPKNHKELGLLSGQTYGNSADLLEGTERGYITLMDEANRRFSNPRLNDIWNEANKKIDNELPFENVPRPPRTEVPGTNFFRKVGEAAKTKTTPVVEGDGTEIFRKIGQATKPKIDKISYSESITKPVLSPKEAKLGEIISDLNDVSHGTAEKFTTPSNILEKAEKFRDISGFKANARDVYRNFKQVFGDKYQEIKNTLLDPFDAAKGRYIDYQKKVLDEMDEKIVKEFGIRKGSKESAAVMDYGEGVLKEGELLSSFGIEKGKKIKEASEWFRQKYDSLLEDVNRVRAEIYPNNPDKIIPKRKDYFRHFEELSTGLQALKNIFENPAGISPTLAGVSDFTTPRSKWLAFAQRRVLNDSTRDAVGGFLNYVPSASYAVNIDPFIGQFRKLGRELAEKTEGSRNINNFIEFLHDFSNDLSGKTSAFDRGLQKIIPGGRKTFAVINWLNNRVKANAILGNAGSSIAQIFNVPQGIASAKQYAIPGATKTLAQIFQPNDAMKMSNFIKERYSSSLYGKFETGALNNTKRFAAWMVGVLDEVGTKFIWNSHYEKAIAQKIANPIKYADDVTRSLVAGRGIGEVPLIQKSKLFQIVAPFQLEVGNLWYVMGDMVKKRDFGALAALFVANYLMNRVAEQVRGSDVVFDPINALIEGFRNQAKDEPIQGRALKTVGRLTGEALSNIPMGQTIANVYPEKGFNIPGVGQISRSELFGEGDPTRFGTGLVVGGLRDPLYKILPAFGGAQIKKTYEGTKALIEGEQRSKDEKPLFDVPFTPSNIIRAPLYGPYATSEGQEYSEAKGREFSLQAAKTRQARREKDRIRPIFEESLELYEAGRVEESTALWNQLSDEEKDIFKKLRDADRTARNEQAERKMLKLVEQLYDLKDDGREAEAIEIWNKLSEEEKELYQKVKKKNGY